MSKELLETGRGVNISKLPHFLREVIINDVLPFAEFWRRIEENNVCSVTYDQAKIMYADFINFESEKPFVHQRFKEYISQL